MGAAGVALRDFGGSLLRLPLAFQLALDDLSSRYRRTVLGPLWIALGQGATILAFVVVFSGLFRMEPREYAPYLAAGFPAWTLLSTFLSDMPHAFINSRGYLESYEVPWLTHIWRRSLSYMLVFFHQLITLFVVMAILGIQPNTYMLMAIPAVAIVMVAGTGAGIFLAVAGARYRDLQPAMVILSGFLFLFTPVIWHTRQLPVDVQWAYQYNPAYYMLTLLRDPLVGQPVASEIWLIACCVAIGFLLLGLVTFVATRRRLYYWL
ncbi:MAG: ABC transporter permease [Hyphomonadaceae bacterium]|nr:ABC transporter permease [Hyphomonadaceae bacterium]